MHLEEYTVDLGYLDKKRMSSEPTRISLEIMSSEARDGIEKITRYPENEDPKPSSKIKFSETFAKITSFHAPDFISPKSLCVKYVRTIFPSPPLVKESTFGFKPGINNNRNIKSRYDVENSNPQSTLQVLPSFEENTSPVTYPDEVEEIIGIPIEVEPLDETPLEDLSLNTCNHDIPLSSREIHSFDELEPQPQPFLSFPPLEVDLGEEIGPEPPIKPPSPDSFRMKEVDHLTNHTPPSPHVASFQPKDTYCYYHPCLGDPNKHYGFKPGLLGQSGSIGVDFSNMEMIENNWKLESKEASFLERGLNSPVMPKEVEKVIFEKKKLGRS
ncbi:hypothetical protein Tco_0792005 [Tanacetum coccineum]